MADKLKPCPFCGGEAEMFAGIVYKLPVIICRNCGATVSFGGKETPKMTKSAWGKRHSKSTKTNKQEVSDNGME